MRPCSCGSCCGVGDEAAPELELDKFPTRVSEPRAYPHVIVILNPGLSSLV